MKSIRQNFRKRLTSKRGFATIASFSVLSILALAGVSYVNSATESVRSARRTVTEVQTTNLCEAGIQDVLRNMWRPFKVNQNFFDMDDNLPSARIDSPLNSVTGSINGVGAYVAGVVRYVEPPNDPYLRLITIRSVGWIDADGDGVLDDNEPSKTVDITSRFELARSQVFDYTYFVNNYGWMDGFGMNDLIVNGDMRANGNFNFLNGSPTVNGSVFAAVNDKLVPRADGLVNAPPVKMSTSAYSTWTPGAPWRIPGESDAAYAARTAAYREMIAARRRPAWSTTNHGADGSNDYESARDFIYRSEASVVGERPAGAIVGDSSGLRSWNRPDLNAATTTVMDTNPTREVVMPDLSDLDTYIAQSQSYKNTKATFADGTPNPNRNLGAYVEVWNSSKNVYERLDTNGVITGSAVLVGTEANPIRIHGPVTVTQDVVIKGTIQGQGTLYSGRNTHIVGSIRYKNGPDFRGGSVAGTDAVNEKRDFLGLAARGSVIMGNPNTFGATYPLAYMTPVNPPAKNVGTYGRFDDAGNWIPPFNAYETDSSGRMRYQSVIPDATMNAVSEGVNQIDAVVYTNFVGGGNMGTSGGGVVFNGTIISRDEAMVVWSLPVVMNYDNRIRERSVSRTPLIDLQLPRSPVLLRSTWQAKNFSYMRGAPLTAATSNGNSGRGRRNDSDDDHDNGHGNDND